MSSERVAEMRARAAQARRVADALFDEEAETALRKLAEDLDAEAARLEKGEAGRGEKD